MEQADFLRALEQAAVRSRAGIGTLGEKSVHAVLKAAYEPHCENQEVPVGGYVADIVGEDGIIEVQTRALWRLKEKLAAFLEVCSVTVVHPVYAAEWISRTDPDTGEVTRRKSPRRGRPSDVLAELYALRKFLGNPRFRLRVVALETERYDIGRARGRKQRLDRVPLAFLGEWAFGRPEDYRQLLPEGLAETFTAAEFGKVLRQRVDEARKSLAVLELLGLAERAGKQERRVLYRLVSEDGQRLDNREETT